MVVCVVDMSTFFRKRKDGWRTEGTPLCHTSNTLSCVIALHVCVCACVCVFVCVHACVCVCVCVVYSFTLCCLRSGRNYNQQAALSLPALCCCFCRPVVGLWTQLSPVKVLLIYWRRRVPMMQCWRSCQGAYLALNALTHSNGVFLCWLPCWLSFWHWSAASEHLTFPVGLRRHVLPDRLR